MPFDGYLTTAILLLTVSALVLEIAAPELVLMGAMIALMGTGVLSPQDAIEGFGSVTLLTIAALLIVAGGVKRTGILSYGADTILGRRPTRTTIFRLMVPIGAASAFLNNTPLVAMGTPAVLDWCKRNQVAPSRLLMPLSFATILGGMCTLIGTSTNIVVDGLVREAGLAPMRLFEIAWVGLPVAVAGVLCIGLIASRALPDRSDPVATLTSERREFLVEMLVDPGSPLSGKSVGDAGLRNLPGLFLINVERGERFLGVPGPGEILCVGDRLVFAGVASTVAELRRQPGLSPAPEAHYDPMAAERRDRLYEAVISLSSPLVGTTIKDIGFRRRYDAAVIAVHRAGQRLDMKIGTVELRIGDVLMIEADDGFDARWADSQDFALVSRVRAEPKPRPHKARVALFILSAMVVLVSLRVMPMLTASFLAVAAMLVARVLTPDDALRSVNPSILLVIAGALALGRALGKSGAAVALAKGLVAVAAPLGSTGLLAAALCLSILLTEILTNAAAVAIVFPLVMATAVQAGLAVRPFAIAVAVGCSASFLTPTGYHTNLMIYGPGGYRFGDFARLGAPLTLIVIVLTLVIVPAVWPLR